ncbi:MAG TPA: sulfotransferase [Caulobacteraceae bacterium]
MTVTLETPAALDGVVREIAARLSGRPADDGVRRALEAACAEPEVTRKTANECGQALLSAGLLEEAGDLYNSIERSYPNEPIGRVGLAQIATQRETWPQALALWDEVLTRFGDRPNSALWRSRRATVLVRLGRGVEAEAIVRKVVTNHPKLENAFVVLLRVLVQTGRLEEALCELEASPFGSSETPPLVETKLNLFVRLRRVEAARLEFQRLLACSEKPALLISLFDFTPAIYEGEDRTAAWVSLLHRLEPMLAGPGAGSLQGAQILRLRLHFALRDYPTFLAAMDRLGEERRLGRHDRMLRAAARALGDPAFPDFSKPKIFGIGLGKTGTTTLGAALAILGFSNVDFINELTKERMCSDDLPIFDAFTDPPTSITFEANFEKFPNARFIYTTRSPESWRDSKLKHWRRKYGDGEIEDDETPMEPQRLVNSYRAHERRVRRFFSDKPKDKFLEFDIFGGQGWAELCGFLGVPTPAQPFPWANRNPVAGDGSSG